MRTKVFAALMCNLSKQLVSSCCGWRIFYILDTFLLRVEQSGPTLGAPKAAVTAFTGKTKKKKIKRHQT